MGKTSIEWTATVNQDGTVLPGYTFNPWSGCSKISEGCRFCYAEVNYSVRIRGVKWGPQGNRIVKAESGWKEPIAWDKQAREGACRACRGRGIPLVRINDKKRVRSEFACEACNGTGKGEPYRARVFCASLADVFEDWQGPMLDAKGEQLWKQWEDAREWDASPIRPSPRSSPLTMQDVRDRLFRLIDATPNLDWLVLTKRPESIAAMMPDYILNRNADGQGHDEIGVRPNLWLGTSCENQQTADERIPHLMRVPAAVRFLSAEPLLGPVDLLQAYYAWTALGPPSKDPKLIRNHHLHWVIVGGESGHGARPCNIAWIRSIVEQCREAKVPVFVKQLGAVIHAQNIIDPLDQFPGAAGRTLKQGPTEDCAEIGLIDRKGGDMAEWPLDLRVREFPAGHIAG